MGVQNRSRYASSGAGRTQSFLRGALVMAGLAILSFALGFFVLSRMMPGESKGAVSIKETIDSVRELSDNNSRSVPASSSSREPERSAPPNRNATVPTPTIEPEEKDDVQKPESPDKTAVPPDTSHQEKPADNASSTPPVVNERPHEAAPPASGENREELPSAPRSETLQKPLSPDGRSDSSTTSASPGTPSETSHNTSDSKERYRVQVGAYSTREAANQVVQQLKDKGFDSFVQTLTDGGRTRYRVQHALYKNRANAETAKERLKAAGFDSFIVKSE